jgi:DNA-binding MarR family transcriptional regulator
MVARRHASSQGAPRPDPTAVTAVDDDPPFRSVGFSLSSLGYAVARRFRETLKPLELEPREFALLRAVGAAEGQSQRALAERLQIPPSRMVAFVDALEGRGLMERRADPGDRRTRALHLTSAGASTLQQAFAVALAFERDLCRDLADDDRERLLDLLAMVAPQLGLAPIADGTHAHAALADE